jgi:hypothetical protein
MKLGTIGLVASVTLVTVLGQLIQADSATNPSYFLWDVGPRSNQVDSGDLILDLSKGCNDSNGMAVNFPGIKNAKSMPLIQIPDFANTQKLINGFGVTIKDNRFFKLIWSFDNFKGGPGPIFFLMPEAHKAPSDSAKEKDSEIHFARTYFALGVVEENLKSSSILNVREGIEGGEWKLPGVSISGTNRISQVSKIADRGYVTAFVTIGNLYVDSRQVFTTYLEPANLIFQDMLLNLGDYDGSKSFEQTMTEVQNYNGPLESNELKSARDAYKELQGLKEDQISKRKDEVCAMRSNQMVERAVALAREKNSKIVFFSYGAAHHFEIAQYLRAANLNYIALIGRVQ